VSTIQNRLRRFAIFEATAGQARKQAAALRPAPQACVSAVARRSHCESAVRDAGQGRQRLLGLAQRASGRSRFPLAGGALAPRGRERAQSWSSSTEAPSESSRLRSQQKSGVGPIGLPSSGHRRGRGRPALAQHHDESGTRVAGPGDTAFVTSSQAEASARRRRQALTHSESPPFVCEQVRARDLRPPCCWPGASLSPCRSVETCFGLGACMLAERIDGLSLIGRLPLLSHFRHFHGRAMRTS
jgi:hypothetical protein